MATTNKTKNIETKTKNIKVYVVKLVWFCEDNSKDKKTQFYVMKDGISAKKKVEELHTSYCEKTLDEYIPHTTYNEHCDMAKGGFNHYFIINITVKEHYLDFSKDELINFQSEP